MEPRRRRRELVFSLRLMLLGVLPAGLWMGWIAWKIREQR